MGPADGSWFLPLYWRGHAGRARSQQFAKPRRPSQRVSRARDLTHDSLPTTDVILCRDCLIHLSFKNIKKALATIKASGSKYLLTTTFPDRRENENTVTGGFRPLNLQIEPFNFPAPICLINEGCDLKGGTEKDKSLALWLIAEIPV